MTQPKNAWHTVIRKRYENACNAYLREFCNKHGFDFEDAKHSWVANQPGTWVMVGDLCFDFETIKTDIDEDAPEEELMKHYTYCVDAAEFNLTQPNFKQWLHGCPRTSEEDLAQLRYVKNQLNELINKQNK